MELPQMDGTQPEPILGEQEVKEMVVSNQLSQDLQQSLDQAEHKEELPHDVHPYLGKLERGGSLVCPESIQESVEEVDGLILYQTVKEETLDTETLMGNTAGQFVQARGIPENYIEDNPVGLSDQVDEISEGQMARDSFIGVPVVQLCDETTGKAVKQLDTKPNEMELESIYSEYAQHSCPDTCVSSPAVTFESEESTIKNSRGVKTQVSMDQENYDSTVNDLTLAPGSRECRNRALAFSLDQDNKDNHFEQNKTKLTPTLPANRIDRKSSHLNFFLLPDSSAGKKPHPFELPIKAEEAKTETFEDVCTDSSEVKHGKFLSSIVKSENMVTKAEQLDYPVKSKTLETKPELLSLPMQSLDNKPEAKPEALRLTASPEGAKFKSETKPEDLEFTTYPDSSEIKLEAKPENLEFRIFPEIRAKTKQELLEADSTVLTPKLEQVDGLVDATGGLVVKSQVKEERPSTPGKNTFSKINTSLSGN